MHADLAAATAPPEPRRLAAALGRLTLPAVVFLTLAIELALAERKYAIFGGGFGQSRTVDTVGETLALFAPLLACHGLMFYLLYRLVRRLHGAGADTVNFHVNFFYFGTVIGAGLLIAKYQALSYFSDALSFQVIRNLGGGSLVEAARYSSSEVALVLFAALGAIGAYVVLRLSLGRRWRATAPLPDFNRLGRRQLAAALLATALLLLAAGRVQDARSALTRFNSPVAAAFLLNAATDFDGDGYGLFSSPTDAQPFDGSRHPYALDRPNNGLDEDGYAGDLVLDAPAKGEALPVRIAGARPHVILVVLESTRGDVLGRRIAGRPVAPVLEALAARGTSAPAFSHVGFTSGSLITLFTGRLAPAGPRGSLFEAFRDNGYRVGVFSGQAERFGGIAEAAGMRRAADIFVDAELLRDERVYSLGSASSLSLDGRTLLREFDRRLGRAEAWRQPTFLYFNLQSAHFPYWHRGMDRILTGEPLARSEIVPRNRARLEATYWNAVAYNDRLLGQLVSRLQRLGIWDDTILVVTGDHGESLFDDGFLGHGHMINSQQTAIPFVVSRRVAASGPVGLADMRRIVLNAAGADVPPQPGATPGRVFQYIGSLDRPSSIGFATGARGWTIFSFDREALWTSRSGRWRDYRTLDPAGRAEADALIREWGRQRWLSRAGA